MDGTIIESNATWNTVTEQFLIAYGIHLEPAALKTIFHEQQGLSIPDSCRLLKKQFNLPGTYEALIEHQETLAQHIKKTPFSFISGFEQFHKKITDRKLQSGLATNAPLSLLSHIADLLDLSRFFGSHMYCINHVNNMGKPHPAIYLHAAEKLNAHPKQCIAIEDSAHGIWAAKNAGIFCIGINTPEYAARISHADMVVTSYNDIDLDAILQSV